MLNVALNSAALNGATWAGRNASGFVNTNFGAADWYGNNLCQMESFLPTKFGTTGSIQHSAPITLSVGASGFELTVFGEVSSNSAVSCQAVGQVATEFGSSLAGCSYQVSGLVVASFGAPSSVAKLGASGPMVTRFGSHVVVSTYSAVSVAPMTGFGAAERRGVSQHVVPGFQTATFGTPLFAGTRHKAFPLAAVLRFGKPLLKRAPLC